MMSNDPAWLKNPVGEKVLRPDGWPTGLEAMAEAAGMFWRFEGRRHLIRKKLSGVLESVDAMDPRPMNLGERPRARGLLGVTAEDMIRWTMEKEKSEKLWKRIHREICGMPLSEAMAIAGPFVKDPFTDEFVPAPKELVLKLPEIIQPITNPIWPPPPPWMLWPPPYTMGSFKDVKDNFKLDFNKSAQITNHISFEFDRLR